MPSHRLFVALRPPKAIRAFLLEKMLGVAAARWQNDDQLHITLRFIGAVDRHQGEDIAAALGHLHAPAPQLHISGVGHFEKSGHANALWAGVNPAAPLEALHQKINQMLLRVGIAPETRAYLPHITLARLGRSAGPLDGYLAANAHLTSPAFTCDHAILYESEMGRGGSLYLPIARFPLSPITENPIVPNP
jgi:2'-5' RNA ligase